MRDHKDITDYASLPTLRLPAGSGRPLTAAECREQLAECQEGLVGCIDPETISYLRSEIAGWERLARERS